MRDDRVYSGFNGPLRGTCLGFAILILAVQSATAFQYPGAPGQDSFSIGGNQGVLGEGDRVPKLEAGFTKPTADHAAQLFIVANMPEGAHAYSITQAAGGPIRTKIKVDSTADVPTIGRFQTATAPDIKHDEEIFPGIALEEQAGKVKWFAPIQLAAGAKPEAVKIEGKVNMQLCDANGCVMPKDYAFTATYRPDVPPEKERAAAAPKGTATKPVSPPAVPDARSTGFSGNPAAIPPGGGTTNSGQPSKETSGSPPSVAAKPRTNVGAGEIDWVPFTNAAELREIVGPGLDLEQVRENVRKQVSELSLWNAILAGFLGGLILNIMPCVLPVIGLKILSFVHSPDIVAAGRSCSTFAIRSACWQFFSFSPCWR